MPKINITVTNTDHMVLRPIVFGVTQDLISLMGLPNNTRVLLPGSVDEEDLPIQTLNRKVNKVYGEELKVTVEVNETYVEDRAHINDLRLKQNLPIFRDANSDITISPYYTHNEVELTIIFRLPNRQSAERVRSEMVRAANQLREGTIHELKYSYLIPTSAIYILSRIHELREIKEPYGESFGEYINKHINPQVTVGSNIIGNNITPVKRETQINVMGNYDFEIVPDKAELDDSRQYHNLNFTYRFRYDKINSLIMRYPFIVNNSHLPEDLYDDVIPYDLALRLQTPGLTTYNYNAFSNHNDRVPFKDGVPIPMYNDWIPETSKDGMVGIARIMLELDGGETILFNLKELGEFKIRDEYITYMENDYDNLTKHRNSIFNFTLYENDMMLNDDALTIDADLNVIINTPINLRRRYNIWFCIYAKFRFLTKDAKVKACRQGSTTVNVIKSLDNTIERRGHLPKVLPNGTINVREFEEASVNFTTEVDSIRGTTKLPHFTVGNFIVISGEN